MSWFQNPAETKTESYRSWQVVVGGLGDLRTRPGMLKFDTDTCGLNTVELLEIRWKPTPAELAANPRIVRLQWMNAGMVNDDLKHYVKIAPLLQPDNSYVGEFNIPRSLYKFNAVNHYPISQIFELDLVRDDTLAQVETEYILLTLKITARNVGGVFGGFGMQYNKGMESTVLNDRT